MRLSYVLYGLGIGFFAAGYVAEIRELKEQQAIWLKATSDGNGSSSSQSSPRRQESRPTTSES